MCLYIYMQKSIWEKEYRKPKLVTGHDKPQAFFLKLIKYLKKENILGGSVLLGSPKFSGLKVLDLGSGTGRNSNYLAQNGARVVGMEISDTAIALAQKRSKHLELDVKYLKQSIGLEYPFGDDEFDLVIDITSSNSLSEKEREIYLTEVSRVLKKSFVKIKISSEGNPKALKSSSNSKTCVLGKGGIFIVRALCKEGDKNAKFLLKNNSGGEKDTYVMPETGLVERVFSEENFREIYSGYFNILKLEKTESYSKIGSKIYKRRFWLAVMEKK